MNPRGQNVLAGGDLDALPDSRIEEIIQNVTVFCRTTPKHKMAIIRAFQANGCIVAMTGDGVNDAPALRLAVSFDFSLFE
jgi:P-type Ca2+ transporter type 2C